MSIYARRRLLIYKVSLEQVDTALKKLDANSEVAVNLPAELRDYSNVFCLKEAEKLLPHQPYNYNIKLKDRQIPL
jgi:hypothetical protein